MSIVFTALKVPTRSTLYEPSPPLLVSSGPARLSSHRTPASITVYAASAELHSLEGQVRRFNLQLSLNVPRSTACVSALHVTAIGSTIFRLLYRRKTRCLWWDDYTAIVPLVMDTSYFIVLWLRVWEKDPGLFNLNGKVVLHWISTTNFITIIWWTRISLALAIVRILPHWDPMHTFTIGLVCAFVVTYIACLSLSFNHCAKDKSWHRPDAPIVLCGSFALGIMGVCTDIISDTLLVAIPLSTLWGVTLKRNQRRLVLSAFSASMLTTLATVVYGTLSFAPFNQGPSRAILMIMAAHIEATVALIVCNLLVVVSYIYRTYLNAQDIEATDKNSGECGRKATPTIGSAGRAMPSSTYVLTEISTQRTFSDYRGSEPLFSVEPEGVEIGAYRNPDGRKSGVEM
ncbi:hypothetical protein Hypma_014728 [Hypsizygus marmoreus]|uniref:Rhodopsin domain-containing protein n=1 Tax=Hypsizygus marmoreus TaxID=39966 RepID=A0A369JDD2_HYPMA|nr:hypothetical protein Hypma_014728 [Hypsizygus marmoreus]